MDYLDISFLIILSFKAKCGFPFNHKTLIRHFFLNNNQIFKFLK